jgi:hypothetical protein
MKAQAKNRDRRSRRLPAAGCLAAVLLLTFLGLAPGSALAAPSLLWHMPDGTIDESMVHAGAVATNPISGDVFVASPRDVSVFDVWGQFKRSWGWNVVSSGPDDEPAVNEVQKLTVSATGGSFQLTYVNKPGDANLSYQTTSPLPFDATPAQVRAAMEELESIAPGDVQVGGGPGDAAGASPYIIEFSGARADTDIPPLVPVASLSGGSASASVETMQDGGSFEICVPANGDVCAWGQEGGSKPGQIRGAVGIAVSDTGAVFVSEQRSDKERSEDEMNFRIQKFDPSGSFLAMWGGEVNKTKSGEPGTTEAERNLCTATDLEAGDVCGAGEPACTREELEGGKTCGVDVPAPGNSEFYYARTSSPSGGIAVGPEGSIFVADQERIQRFGPDGAFLGEVASPGRPLGALAMDSAGNFFVTTKEKESVFERLLDDVVELSPTGAEVRKLAVQEPTAVAVGETGNVYAVSPILIINAAKLRDRVVVFDKDGSRLFPTAEEEAEANQREDEGRAGERFGETGAELFGLATGNGCEIPGDDLYVSGWFGGLNPPFALDAYGPPPQDPNCEPPALPPTIQTQYAASVGTDTATLEARVNPRFWANTTYYVEFGTGKCTDGGCTLQQPAAPGKALTEEVTSSQLPATIELSDLSPGTTYHYRFVAQSGGGGPVRGAGGTPLADGSEGSFTTFALSEPNLSCPNQALRPGPSAALPDCRAYEMVSPVDKNNGDIVGLIANDGRVGTLNQSSADGSRVTYSSYRAFGDAQSSPATVAYLASRSSGGWGSEAISPPGGASVLEPIQAINNQFKAFSTDLCTAWLWEESGQVLAPGAIPGYANLYRRQNCGSAAGSYAALTVPTVAPSRTPDRFVPEFQGVSSDGSAAVFRVQDSLLSEIPDPGLTHPMVYEATGEGELTPVCILPNGTPWTGGCSVGTGGFPYGRGDTAHNAVSADGSRVYWTAKDKNNGKLYLRENSNQPPSELAGGKCVQEELACTYLVSNEDARFWGASANGSRAFYSTGALGIDTGSGQATLFEFDAVTRSSSEVAGKVDGVLGMSGDGSRVYLVSEESLDTGGIEGEPNLYLYEGGQFTFIGELSPADAAGTSATQVSTVHVEPRFHVAQVTPNGQGLVFMSNSTALSTAAAGYDNTDPDTGRALEVFLYDASSGALRCVSCNPSGARPTAKNIAATKEDRAQWAAAAIPTSQSSSNVVPRVLTPDGKRIFFESFEPLVPGDVNAKKDVYQWEASGSGDCLEGDPTFVSAAGGCLSLISSGKSTSAAEITAVSQSGDDVFFVTAESLLPQDEGLVDVYDARVGGGFPQSVAPDPCEGETCQGPAAPSPPLQAPLSSTYQGPSNSPPAKQKRCPKGKRKVKRHGKVLCVKKHRHRSKPNRRHSR